MHRAMIIKEDPVWVQASSVVLHVMRDLVKARAWRGLGVVIFVVGLRVVLCFSVDIFRFVVNVHT